MPAKKSNQQQQQQQDLVARRDQLSQRIEQLQLQLDEAVAERFELDTEIQRIRFVGDGEVEGDSDGSGCGGDADCAALKASLEKIRQQFEQSCHTPKDYDSDVPFKCSDDFADTSSFDDWTDQQLEIFNSRLDKVISVAELEQSLLSRTNSYSSSTSINNASAATQHQEDESSAKSKTTTAKNQKNQNSKNSASHDNAVLETFLSGVEAALRILFRTTEAINSMVDTVSKIEGADTGILLECRDLLMEHWHRVLGDEALIGKSPIERAQGVDERFTKFFQLKPDFGEMLCNELERIGKPFSLLVALPEATTN